MEVTIIDENSHLSYRRHANLSRPHWNTLRIDEIWSRSIVNESFLTTRTEKCNAHIVSASVAPSISLDIFTGISTKRLTNSNGIGLSVSVVFETYLATIWACDSSEEIDNEATPNSSTETIFGLVWLCHLISCYHGLLIVFLNYHSKHPVLQQYPYAGFPLYFTWDSNARMWKPGRLEVQIGRMYLANTFQGIVLFRCLLNVVPHSVSKRYVPSTMFFLFLLKWRTGLAVFVHFWLRSML